MTQPRAVFLLPRHMTSWAELWPLATMLADDGQVTPVMVLATPAMSEKVALCRNHGVEVADVTSEIFQLAPARPSPRVEAWLERHPRLGNSLPVAAVRMAAFSRRLRAEKRVCETLLRRWRPLAVLMPGDRELSPVPTMLRAAADLGIPRVIAATSIPFIEGVAVPRKTSPAFRVAWRDMPPLFNVLAARRHPGQACQTAYGRLLFSPGWRILALARQRMLSNNPWVQGGGLSTHILQHSREKMQRYLDLGVSAEKMVMIGDPTLDPLYETWKRRDEVRQELIAEHGFVDDRPLVVVAVPNEAEHGLSDWPTHLSRLRAFLSRLARLRANVLLSLHPKSRREDYQALASDLGFDFVRERLAQTLPAVDLFLCSCSTTVHWAKLCAVPTINLDYLRLGMDYFKEPVGIAEVNTPDEFEAVLPDYLSFTRSDRMAELRAHAATIAEETLFDGRAGERLRHFLVSLSGNRDTAPELTSDSRTAAA